MICHPIRFSVTASVFARGKPAVQSKMRYLGESRLRKPHSRMPALRKLSWAKIDVPRRTPPNRSAIGMMR